MGVLDILPMDEADADAVDFTPSLLLDEETGELPLGLRRALSLLELLCEGETGLGGFELPRGAWADDEAKLAALLVLALRSWSADR